MIKDDLFKHKNAKIIIHSHALGEKRTIRVPRRHQRLRGS